MSVGSGSKVSRADYFFFFLIVSKVCAVLSRSVMSDSWQPRGLQPSRLFCPWGFSRQEYWNGLSCPYSFLQKFQCTINRLPLCRKTLHIKRHLQAQENSLIMYHLSIFALISSQRLLKIYVLLQFISKHLLLFVLSKEFYSFRVTFRLLTILSLFYLWGERMLYFYCLLRYQTQIRTLQKEKITGQCL